MKFKNIIALSLLGICGGTVTTSLANNNYVYAASTNDDYPDITSKFDVNNMNQYDDSDLFTDVSIKKFYVQSISYDKHHNERIIFTNTPESTNYYFTVLQGRKHKKRIAVGDPITIKGQLNGRLEIEKTQANSWFAKKYFGKNAIMVLTASYK